MFGRHVTRYLTAYQHGELTASKKLQVEAHVRECRQCSEALEGVQFVAQQMTTSLQTTPAPESLWAEIRGATVPFPRRLRLQVVLAGLTLVVTVVATWILARNVPPRVSERASWQVEQVRGTPRIGDAGFSQVARLRTGETLQTDALSEAEVRIADIGRLTVNPNTKIRLVVTKEDEHRIALEHGKVEATTWSPPRLFVVDTPSARAVDLGCRYTLEVDEDGGSLLRVQLGMVSLERFGRSAYVPAGALARTHPGWGPGTPFREDASQRFQAALNAIDFGSNAQDISKQLDVILGEAQHADAFTLWHLLPRVGAADRERLFESLSKFVEPPAEVQRSGIIGLDPTMLRAWAESIPELWWMKREPR